MATGATIAAAVFAAGAYLAARDQARIAQDALVAGERPWLMLADIKPATLSSDDEAGVTLWVNILAKNIGHSPAQNVWVNARLLIVENSDPRPDIVMHAVCREVRESPVMFPGPVIFPDQTEHTNRGVPHSFNIQAKDVWAVRAAWIKSTHDNEMARNRPDRAEAWAAAHSEFPFHAPLYFVGCVNYRSSDNALYFQTSFMFSVSSNSSGNSFPLLGGQPPVIRYPEPSPSDPETLMVFPRQFQRSISGDQIKLEPALQPARAPSRPRQRAVASEALGRCGGCYIIPVHLQTSRKDAFLSVVLEALSAGVPTVAFEGAGGIPGLLREHDAGAVVPLGDAAAMVRSMAALARGASSARAKRLAGGARRHFAFDAYAAALLGLALPALPRISVAVPSHQYARYLPDRLRTVFGQTHPVLEVLVLDDASTDGSAEVARAAADTARRDITLVVNKANSGSPFRQWQRAAELARGEWLWIAEADDLSEPRFLETLAHAVQGVPDAVLAFTDSASVDAEGGRSGRATSRTMPKVGPTASPARWPRTAWSPRPSSWRSAWPSAT